MDLVGFLGQFAIVAAAGVVAAVLMAWIRLPAVAGFLFAGALVGPYALGLVNDARTISTLAEVGVVLLLFTIGLEFSLTRFARIWNMVIVGGGLQVGLTTLAVLGVCLALGYNSFQGIFIGFVLAQSSTSIVLQNLSRRREVDAPHGRFIVGAQIFQDLCVVPMMLVIPLLAGLGGGNFGLDLGLALGKAALMVTAVVLLSRIIVPPIFQRVAAARSRESFLMAVLVTCIGTAYLTSLAGLSLALGAFLAGLVIAGSPFGQRAMTDVLPLRDLFASLFFLSLGMYFDIRAFFEHPIAVALVFVGILVGKSLIAALAAMAMRFPARVATIGGIGMAQFSEMGFVLATLPQAAGIVSPDVLKVLFAAGILTMFVTPLTMAFAPSFTAGAALLRPLERLLGARGIAQQTERDESMSEHVIIAGYGLAGRMLANALKASGMQYLILELNAETVKMARELREPAYYADITNDETLDHAHINKARALVIMINDPDAVRRAIANARRLSPELPIYVRTHYLSEQQQLNGAGAHDIVVEELEAGIELMARVLRDSGVARNVITERVKEARLETQPSARKETLPRRKLKNVAELDELKIESCLIREGHFAIGKSTAGINLRKETGATLVALRRNGDLVEQPDIRAPFIAGDVLYLVGSKESVNAAMIFLEKGELREETSVLKRVPEKEDPPRSDMVHVLPERPQ
ncbi:Putative cation/proton antiporter YbaL [Planctomycetaceae bacterium]|nr:Putative cation/proton antiporter YbaL [Planctomycetaceae bacterium]